MIKRFSFILVILCILLISLVACEKKQNENVKIGVFMGVGPAKRWDNEKIYMEQRAKELGINIEVRINRDPNIEIVDKDCKNLIDSGIDALVFVPRDATKAQNVLDYAKGNKVPVINYSRGIESPDVALFIGYDNSRIGRRLGQYLTEAVYKGDYIVLRGDMNDNNAMLLYQGAIDYIRSIENDINIILDEAVPNWSPGLAKKMVKDVVLANGKNVDAILAPNDQIAGACVQALEELGITKHVTITGMDSELEAAKRIIAGKQDATIYMDLNALSQTAVDEAVKAAKNEPLSVNSEIKLENGKTIKANLTTGQLVTKGNLDRLLIESGYFTKEQVYGK